MKLLHLVIKKNGSGNYSSLAAIILLIIKCVRCICNSNTWVLMLCHCTAMSKKCLDELRIVQKLVLWRVCSIKFFKKSVHSIKALLFINEAPSYLSEELLRIEGIKVQFLPPNGTFLFQWVVQGVLENFKRIESVYCNLCCKKWTKVAILEQFAIKKGMKWDQNILNEQLELGFNPLLCIQKANATVRNSPKTQLILILSFMKLWDI